ncbi:PREDICTED: uncharacterized protein LOC109211392 [Nicotiana attenuata]|uniref:uncharacterized protein LOC109211392 n=1 Tax=Nicotiana attenuata TaxID=49451 RepID=UPI000904C073|nr:PREDICTED: uncharacterized protein LOC109211392 [Nicotiana attenuata]
MATEVELSKQCLPISKVPKYSSDWVIKVFVVRRSKVIPYKNQRNEGVFKTLILVDEEGTKIQATLFNKHVEKRKDFFELSRSYFIINGRLDRVNPNYSSVHKEVEIAFTDNTIIKESKTNISTQEFSNGFLFLEKAEKLTEDVVVILVTVKSLIEEGRSRRREIIVTNERYDLTSITLWGDFAENDGELLEKMKYDKPILGFCDVRVSIYKGNFGISTIPVSSVLINPTIQKATELRNWMCSIDDDARNYLYKEFPEHYVWNPQPKIWTKRKTRSVIGRIAIANPREGERYYERLSLNHVRGPFSFEDLLTVNGKKCETFKEAAKQRGLLESDNSISECLCEAVVFKMPSALRSLFATVLVHCNPTDIRNLWETYYDDMSEDFRRMHENSPATQLQFTLKSVNYYLESMGKSVEKYDLPKINQQSCQKITSECREIIEETSMKVPVEDYEAQSKLNHEQAQAFKTILYSVDSGTTRLFFVDGPGGTGKTFLYRALLANVRSRGMIALATATSGVAAAILPEGLTAHSRFDIPLQTNDTTMTKMSKESGAAKLIR